MARDFFNNAYLAALGVATDRSSPCRHYFFGAIGRRSDGTIVKARNIASQGVNVRAHAECRVTMKGAKEIWVVRVSRLTGNLLDSEPCTKCMYIMRARGVNVVHFVKEGKYKRFQF